MQVMEASPCWRGACWRRQALAVECLPAEAGPARRTSSQCLGGPQCCGVAGGWQRDPWALLRLQLQSQAWLPSRHPWCSYTCSGSKTLTCSLCRPAQTQCCYLSDSTRCRRSRQSRPTPKRATHGCTTHAAACSKQCATHATSTQRLHSSACVVAQLRLPVWRVSAPMLRVSAPLVRATHTGMQLARGYGAAHFCCRGAAAPTVLFGAGEAGGLGGGRGDARVVACAAQCKGLAGGRARACEQSDTLQRLRAIK